VGNALEIHECLQILKGEPPLNPGKNYEDTKILSLELAAQMLSLSGFDEDLQACRTACLEKLRDGSAYAHFEKFVRAQGGRLEEFNLGAPQVMEIKAEHDGYVNFLSAKSIGLASVLLGAGRQAQTDKINPYVGIEVFRSQ